MESSKAKWTDERTDDLAEQLGRFEARVESRFDRLDSRIDERIDRLEGRLDDRFDRLQIGLLITMGSIVAAFVANLI